MKKGFCIDKGLGEYTAKPLKVPIVHASITILILRFSRRYFVWSLSLRLRPSIQVYILEPTNSIGVSVIG